MDQNGQPMAVGSPDQMRGSEQYSESMRPQGFGNVGYLRNTACSYPFKARHSSFQQAASLGARVPGGRECPSPALTKGGKLAVLLQSGLQRALAGRAAQEQATVRLARATDAVGRVTTFGYDALSRPASVTNAAIQAMPVVQRAYTPDGLTASLTIARSNTVFNVTNLAYDGFDRLATTTYPDSSTEVLSYDAGGNVLTRKTRKGDTITFTYDTLNRLSTKVAPSEPTVTYTYDLAGRLTAASDTSAAMTAAASPAGTLGTITVSYDQANRPVGFSYGPAPAQAAPTASQSGFADATNRRIAILG